MIAPTARQTTSPTAAIAAIQSPEISGRMAALGIDKVPTIVLRHLSAAQKEALRLADNEVVVLDRGTVYVDSNGTTTIVDTLPAGMLYRSFSAGTSGFSCTGL
mgnify:CR=1 FL=1